MLYPILKYLKKKDILPLPEVLLYLQPYVSCNISKPTLEAIFVLNKEDIRRQVEGISEPNMNQNSKIHHSSSKVYEPNSINPTVKSE